MTNTIKFEGVTLSQVVGELNFTPKELNDRMTENDKTIERFLGENPKFGFIVYYVGQQLIAFIVNKKKWGRWNIGITRKDGNKLYWVEVAYLQDEKSKSQIWGYRAKGMAINNLQHNFSLILRERFPSHSSLKEFFQRWLTEFVEGKV